MAEEVGSTTRPPVTLPSKRYAPDGIADLRELFLSSCAISAFASPATARFPFAGGEEADNVISGTLSSNYCTEGQGPIPLEIDGAYGAVEPIPTIAQDMPVDGFSFSATFTQGEIPVGTYNVSSLRMNEFSYMMPEKLTIKP